MRETEHRERERDETKKEIGGDATRWVDAFPSTSTSSASFKKKKRLRPTAAAASASAAAAPPAAAAAAASANKTKKSPSLLSSVDWRFVARHLPWLQALAVVVITVIPLIVLEAAGKPRQRPFDVYDASISYSYRPDTVPAMAAFFAPVAGWLVTAAAVEFVAASKRAKRSSAAAAAAATAAALAVLYHTFDVASCLLVTALVTEATKLGVGRLRPYFLSACSPTDPAMAATLAIGDARPPCDPVPGLQQRNARVSFPSGHSSTSMCTCAFAAFYVVWAAVLRGEGEGEEEEGAGRGHDDDDDGRGGGAGGAQTSPSCSAAAKKKSSLDFRNGDFLRFVALLWALVLMGAPWVVGASRITDNRHHPSDVVAGLGLGFVVAGLFFARSVGGRRALPAYSEGDGGGGSSSSSSAEAGKGGRRRSGAEALV